ncbi:MAG TPA: gluconate 2-dehydrogenase subunit 3 family protein [Vicinamibacterales bacterium]
MSLSVLAGHALFPRVLELVALDAGAAAQGAADWRPEVLSPEQGRVLAEIVETIIPATDTPGATAARVHVFVDLMLAHCTPAEPRRTAIAAIDTLGERFLAASPDERLAQLQAIDAGALALLKELTILGYCNSQIGATQALAYVKVPGEYRGCIPLGPDQRAWATR